MPISNQPEKAPLPTPPVSANEPDAPIKWNQLLERCGGEVSLVNAIAKRFVAQVPADLDRLADALANSDADAARRHAHSLKSTTAYMSLDAASLACKQMEEFAREGRLAEAAPLLPPLRAQIEKAIDWLAQHPPADMALSA